MPVCSAQGDVGYLAPFIAALHRFPVLLQRLLVTKATQSPGQRYTFLFFDPKSNPVEVSIDDRVPCDAHRSSCFVQSISQNWFPVLLEKAYAKFVGGYDSLDNCTPHETLHDLTGRPVSHIPFDRKLADAVNLGDYTGAAFWRRIAYDLSRGDVLLCLAADV